jgi:hypothetical protein
VRLRDAGNRVDAATGVGTDTHGALGVVDGDTVAIPRPRLRSYALGEALDVL